MNNLLVHEQHVVETPPLCWSPVKRKLVTQVVLKQGSVIQLGAASPRNDSFLDDTRVASQVTGPDVNCQQLLILPILMIVSQEA
jgi:hypothetical protein